MAHEYTVTTPHGDVHLKTDDHHSVFDSIEDFLRHHEKSIANAVGVANLTIGALGLYLQHGRRGPRLK